MSELGKNLFDGLGDLGFDNLDELDLYEIKKNSTISTPSDLITDEENEIEKTLSYLFDRTLECPVCNKAIKARSVKKDAYRVHKKDSDMFIHYSLINPYFYDVWVCTTCGYSALKVDFENIRSHQKDLVTNNISTKWKQKVYPEIYDVEIAIERYKLALFNAVIIQAPSSQKAMICLKIAWMYRLNNENSAEISFIKKAIDGFKDAYINERFPIYKMDNFSVIYLIGELYRRIGNTDEAMQWFSNLITTPNAPQKLKDKARDQKDLIQEDQDEQIKQNDTSTKMNTVSSVVPDSNNKKSLFSKLFSK